MEPCCEKQFGKRIHAFRDRQELKAKLTRKEEGDQKLRDEATLTWLGRVKYATWDIFEEPTSSITARVFLLQLDCTKIM